MEVDYLLIGAGISGLVLRRMLEGQSVAVVDPNPGAYKVGESVVPEQFEHPIMRALLPKVQALPSFSRKDGTTFVSDDSVASFPLPAREAGVAMHVARSEFELLLIREWNIDVLREKVLDIDVKERRVRTSERTWDVKKQIIDCSGAAMVVAGMLGDVSSLWPVWATWGYFDIDDNDDARFWASVTAAGKKYLRYDALRRSVLEVNELPGWSPSRSTTLTQLGDGLWSWQIPLFGSKLLSCGLVSRHGPITNEEFLETAISRRSANYVLSRASEKHAPEYRRIHRREGFARRARTAATQDYILLADAYGFADPVYSVGTAVAVNSAIQLGNILTGETGWNERVCALWSRDTERLLAHAIAGFEFWYSGQILTSDAVANEIRDNFLVGNAFQARAAAHYSEVLRDASLTGRAVRDAEGAPAETPLTEFNGEDLSRIRSLLGVTAASAFAGWDFVGGFRRRRGAQLRWVRPGAPELLMDLDFDLAGQSFMRAGRIGLTIMDTVDGPYPFSANVARLFDQFCARVTAAESEWARLAS